MNNNTSIVLTADDRTRAGFASATASLNTLRASAASVSAALAGLGAADNMRDLAIATGTSVEALASYQLAAEQSGTSIEDVSAGMGKLSVFMAKNAEEAQKLGLTASDPAQAFAQLADVLARVEDPAQRNAIAAQVLGKSYRELMPLLSQGGDELRRQAAAAAPYAAKMGELAEQADKFNDSLAALKQSGATFGVSISNMLLPSMNGMLERFNDAILLSQRHGGFISLVLDGVNPTGDNVSELQNVTAEIKQLEEMRALYQKQVDKKQRSADTIAPLDAEIERYKAIKKTLQEIQAEDALKLNDKFKTSNYKQALPPALTLPDTIDPKFADKIAKALDTTALDKFTAKFSATRAKLEAEYAALKQTFGETTSGPVTGSDIQQQNIAKAREAIAGKDAAGAQAALESGKSRLKELSASGAPSFELNYLADQMKKLEQQAVDLAENIAGKTRDGLVKMTGDMNQQIAQVKNPELKINTDLLKQSIDAAVESARQQLAANPLVVPVIAAPNISSNGALSVDLSTTARKLGGSK